MHTKLFMAATAGTLFSLLAGAQEVVVWSRQQVSVPPEYCWQFHSQLVRAQDCGDFDGDGLNDNLLTINAGVSQGHSYSVMCQYSRPIFFRHNAVRSSGATAASSFSASGSIRRVMGDVNGDGFTDVIARSSSQFSSWVHLFSGPDGAHLFPSQPTEFFRNAVPIGDVNGDGRDDLGVPSGNDFEMRSGADLAVVRTVPNVGDFARAGDSNQDGRDDILVVADDAEYVIVLSGADGSILHAISTPFVRRLVAAELGDLNEDGFDDFAVQQDATLTIYSGADGSQLRQGTIQLQDQFILSHFVGDFLEKVSDFDGDGIHDVLAGAGVYSGVDLTPLWVASQSASTSDTLMGVAADSNDNGRSEVLVRRSVSSFDIVVGDFGFGVVAGHDADIIELAGPPAARARTRYAGCPGSSNSIPRIDVRGLPRLGRPMHIRLEAGRANTTAVLHFGVPLAAPVDLAFLGAPGCLITTNPWVLIHVPSDSAGFISLPLTIPIGAAASGFEYSAQWLMLDQGANALGLTTSGELQLRVTN